LFFVEYSSEVQTHIELGKGLKSLFFRLFAVDWLASLKFLFKIKMSLLVSDVHLLSFILRVIPQMLWYCWFALGASSKFCWSSPQIFCWEDFWGQNVACADDENWQLTDAESLKVAAVATQQ